MTKLMVKATGMCGYILFVKLCNFFHNTCVKSSNLGKTKWLSNPFTTRKHFLWSTKERAIYVKKQKHVSETTGHLNYATASGWSVNKDNWLEAFWKMCIFSFSILHFLFYSILRIKCYIKAEPRDNTIIETFKEKKIKEKLTRKILEYCSVMSDKR